MKPNIVYKMTIEQFEKWLKDGSKRLKQYKEDILKDERTEHL